MVFGAATRRAQTFISFDTKLEASANLSNWQICHVIRLSHNAISARANSNFSVKIALQLTTTITHQHDSR